MINNHSSKMSNLTTKLVEFIIKYPKAYFFLKKLKVSIQKIIYSSLKVFNKQNDLIYDKGFFNQNLKTNIPIAEKLVVALIKYFSPKSVVDVGCGTAEYLQEFKKRGLKVKGYEGSRYAIQLALIDKELIEYTDLRKKIQSKERFDLAICLEVAEHIEKKFSEVLISSLANLSDTVVFSAAYPGQGGHFHINEQPKEYWIGLWNNKSFKYMEELTEAIKVEFKINKVLWWYYVNLMVFKKTEDYFV